MVPTTTGPTTDRHWILTSALARVFSSTTIAHPPAPAQPTPSVFFLLSSYSQSLPIIVVDPHNFSPHKNFHATTMVSRADELILLGKTTKISLFSESRTYTDENGAYVAATMDKDLDRDDRKTLLCDVSSVYQFLTVCDDECIHTVTRPMPATATTGQALTLVNLSDTIGTPCPASINSSRFWSFFCTLVPKDIAAEFALRTTPDDPDTIGGPPLPANAAAGTTAIAPSMARLDLQFATPAGSSDKPKFVALPLLCPLPFGVTIPCGWPVGDPLPPSALPFPLAEVWHQGMAYCIRMNSSRSLTQGGPLFDCSKIQSKFFNGAPIEAQLTEPLPLLFPNSAKFLYVTANARALEDATWTRLGLTVPTPLSQPMGMAATGAPSSFGPQEVSALVKSLQTATPRTVSLHDQEYTAHAISTQHRYQLAFASLVPSPIPGEPPVVVPAQLHPTFIKALCATKTQMATRDLQSFLETAIALAIGSDHRLDNACCLSVDLLDIPFVKALCNFQLGSKPLNLEPEWVKTHIGVAHFVTPKTDSLVFKTRVSDGRKVLSTEMAMDATQATRHARKHVDLYYMGRLSTPDHI